MIPRNWKATASKMPDREAVGFLSSIVDDVEKAIIQQDEYRIRWCRNELNLYRQSARVFLLLYARRGQIVSRETIYSALQSNTDGGEKSVWDPSRTAIRRALSRLGGSLESVRGVGYKMNCPDIPQLERKDP